MNKDRYRVNMMRQKDRVAFDVKDLVHGSEELLRSTASYTSAEINDAREKLRKQVDAARHAVGDWNSTARDRYHRATAATDEYVHERPWAVAGIALVVGIVIGHCLRSGSSDRY